MKNSYTYLAKVEKDSECGGYTVDFPDLLGLVYHVDTVDGRAQKNLERLMKGWLKAMLNDGEQPPEPTAQLVSCLPQGRLDLLVTADVIYRRPKDQ